MLCLVCVCTVYVMAIKEMKVKPLLLTNANTKNYPCLSVYVLLQEDDRRVLLLLYGQLDADQSSVII